MKSSALRRWLREERAREHAEALAAGPFLAFVGPVQLVDASRAMATVTSLRERRMQMAMSAWVRAQERYFRSRGRYIDGI